MPTNSRALRLECSQRYEKRDLGNVLIDKYPSRYSIFIDLLLYARIALYYTRYFLIFVCLYYRKIISLKISLFRYNEIKGMKESKDVYLDAL